MLVHVCARMRVSPHIHFTNTYTYTWMEVIRQDIEAKGLSKGILLDSNEWRKLIHVPDPA